MRTSNVVSLSLSRVPCLVRVSTRGSANSSERKTNTRTHLSAEGSRAIERGVHAAKRQEQRGWKKSERVNGSCGDAGQKKNSSFNPDLFPFLLPLRALSSLSLSLSFSRNTGTKTETNALRKQAPPSLQPSQPAALDADPRRSGSTGLGPPLHRLEPPLDLGRLAPLAPAASRPLGGVGAGLHDVVEPGRSRGSRPAPRGRVPGRRRPAGGRWRQYRLQRPRG